MPAPAPDAYGFTSAFLLRCAREAAEQPAQDEWIDLAAVLGACAGAEAWVNEFLHRLRVEQPALIDAGQLRRAKIAVDAAGLYERDARLMRKIEVLYASLADAQLDRGSLAVQQFELLLDCRNFLVHSKPEALHLDEAPSPDGFEVITMQTELHPLVERLVAYGVIGRPTPDAVHLATGALLQRPLARWAHNTALAMIRLVAERVAHVGWRELLLLEHNLEPLPERSPA